MTRSDTALSRALAQRLAEAEAIIDTGPGIPRSDSSPLPEIGGLYLGFVAQMVESVTKPRSSISSMLAISAAMSCA